MLTVRRLIQQTRRGDFFTSIDLKDAYFHISIVPRHRKFLRFAFQGTVYEYTRMPFGYTLAPRVFTRVVEAALLPLRRQGVRVLAYLDDLLILAPSEEDAVLHTRLVINHLINLGLAINWEKSSLIPSQTVVYLGIQLNTIDMRARLSEPRRVSVARALNLFRVGRRVTALSAMILLGLLAAAHVVVPLGLLHMRHMQRWFSQLRVDPVRHRFRLLSVPLSLRRSLAYWRNGRAIEQGVRLGRVTSYVQVFTDASLSGWGGTCQGQAVGGVWPPSTRHINLLELETVRLVLRHFEPLVQGCDVQVQSDNTATVAYINRQGGVRSQALHRAAEGLWHWAHKRLRSLSACHIPGVLNVGADLMSRGGPRDDEWQLCPQIVLQLWSRFGTAQVDLFASRETAQCPLWFSARREDNPPLGVDAFAHEPWPKCLLYAFPPRLLLPRLVERVRTERLSVILVAPDCPQELWFAELQPLVRAGPWQIPMLSTALSQAGGSVTMWPVLRSPLWAWHLTGAG